VVALDEEAKSAVAVIKQLENEINETEAELADVTALGNAQNQVAMNSQESIAMNSSTSRLQKVLGIPTGRRRVGSSANPFCRITSDSRGSENKEML